MAENIAAIEKKKPPRGKNQSTHKLTVQEVLYEEPGPKAKRQIRVWTALSLIALAVLVWRIIDQFAENGQLDAKYWSFFLRHTTWRFIGEGLLGTVEAAVLAGVIAFVLGFLLMRGRISEHKVLQQVCMALIEFTRGVPTLLFIYFFFLVVPKTGIQMGALWKISLPVAISACGVVAEVLRSGVNGVPKGQKEAAMSLGMRDRHVFYKVIFPQAFRYVIPSLISEIVIVVKDTTLAYVVSFPDLMQNAKVLISNYDAMLQIYLVVAIIYILINYGLNKIAKSVQART